MRGIESRLKRLEGLAGQLPGRVEPMALRCTGGVHDREHPNHGPWCRETSMAASRILWDEPERVQLDPGEPAPPPTMMEEIYDTPHFDPALEALILRHRAAVKAARESGEKVRFDHPVFRAALAEVVTFVDDALADRKWVME